MLILGGLSIVSVAGVALYKNYTQNKQIEAALQMAKNENHQINIATDDRFIMVLNLNHKSSLSFAGNSVSIQE